MGNVFRSNEVYKHFRYDIDKTVKTVPVKGMYISGEYRPPYYDEMGVHISQITSQKATVASFQDVSETNGEDAMMKIIDFSLSNLDQLTFVEYTVASTSAGEDAMMKALDFTLTPIQPDFDWYESEKISAGEDAMMKALDFTLTPITLELVRYGKKRSNSTPEPILRISTITSADCTVENYNS